MEKNINQWGWLTRMTLDQDYLDITTLDTSIDRFNLMSPGIIRFEGEAPATPEILKSVMNWLKNETPKIPDWKKEWMCLYCGTPQPLPNRNCDKCGAPRNWLIG